MSAAADTVYRRAHRLSRPRNHEGCGPDDWRADGHSAGICVACCAFADLASQLAEVPTPGLDATRESYAPDGWTDARWHMEAIADSGHEVFGWNGRWRATCPWCSWEALGQHKRDVVVPYQAHQRERWQTCASELRAAGLLGPVASAD